MRKVCSNPWCKGTFDYEERDIIISFDEQTNESTKVEPKVCPKCKSFDTELSDGVTWKDKTYTDSYGFNKPMPFNYKITNFR